MLNWSEQDKKDIKAAERKACWKAFMFGAAIGAALPVIDRLTGNIREPKTWLEELEENGCDYE